MKKWYKNYNGVFFCWLVLPILKWIMVYRNGDHTFFISYIVIFFIYLTESKYICAGLQRFSRYHKNTGIFFIEPIFPVGSAYLDKKYLCFWYMYTYHNTNLLWWVLYIDFGIMAYTYPKIFCIQLFVVEVYLVLLTSMQS